MLQQFLEVITLGNMDVTVLNEKLFTDRAHSWNGARKSHSLVYKREVDYTDVSEPQ